MLERFLNLPYKKIALLSSDIDYKDNNQVFALPENWTMGEQEIYCLIEKQINFINGDI